MIRIRHHSDFVGWNEIRVSSRRGRSCHGRSRIAAGLADVTDLAAGLRGRGRQSSGQSDQNRRRCWSLVRCSVERYDASGQQWRGHRGIRSSTMGAGRGRHTVGTFSLEGNIIVRARRSSLALSYLLALMATDAGAADSGSFRATITAALVVVKSPEKGAPKIGTLQPGDSVLTALSDGHPGWAFVAGGPDNRFLLG